MELEIEIEIDLLASHKGSSRQHGAGEIRTASTAQ